MDTGLACFISTDAVQSVICVMGRIHDGFRVCIGFFLVCHPSHYHHTVNLLTGIKHIP